MTEAREFDVPPMSARAFEVKAGQTVRIIDVGGGQPGDFVAFKAADLSVKLSQARTRVENSTVRVTRGHALWTNAQPPEVMFTITEDSFGSHDLLYTPCCRYALGKRFGVSRDGCLETLARALGPWRVPIHEVPDPLNLFFQVRIDACGAMEIEESASRPGSAIGLRAHMDCVAAVATCAVPLPGRKNSAFRVCILEA